MTLEPMELLEGLAHWLADDGRLYRERAANAQRLGNPRAAYDAADLIWDLTEKGTVRPQARARLSTEKLKNLLLQFGVSTND